MNAATRHQRRLDLVRREMDLRGALRFDGSNLVDVWSSDGSLESLRDGVLPMACGSTAPFGSSARSISRPVRSDGADGFPAGSVVLAGNRLLILTGWAT